MLEVAMCYEYGDCVAYDSAVAELWYKRAFDGGSQVAMLKCANFALWRKDFEPCEEILAIGVEQDWPAAIFFLAWCRHKQSDSRDTYRKIRPLLVKAARRGHPGADFMLTHFMVNGKFGGLEIPLGMLRAVPAAIRWTRINAELARITNEGKSSE
jgi:TPR repeat protein